MKNKYNFLLTVILLTAFHFYSKAQQTILVPFSGSNAIQCGNSSILMDHAGSNNYNNNANGYTILYAGSQASMSIAGTYTIESGFDYIRIYDGIGTGGTLLQTYTGTGTINFSSIAGQTITLEFTSDVSVTFAGFNLAVTYFGPCYSINCSGTPSSNSVIPSTSVVCPGYGVSSLTLATPLLMNNIAYQWQSSTTSSVGPFTSIPGATLNSMTTPTANVTTWYNVILTCTNAGSPSNAVACEIQTIATTTNNIPYFESFEGISAADELPNCSWSVSNASQCRTSDAPLFSNRFARTGSKYAYFEPDQSNPTASYQYYSNGIQLNAGVTYSASVWYNTSGFTSFQNIDLAIGPNQSSTGQMLINSNLSPQNSTYLPLSGTFTVPSSGLYYVAISATDNFGFGFLSWDDLEITAPCTIAGNSPTLTLTGVPSICFGDSTSLIATGMGTFTWSTGATGSSIVVSPTINTVYTVLLTNPNSFCSNMASQSIVVNPLPQTSIFAVDEELCLGSSTKLYAFGASSYSWNTSSNATALTISPTVTTTYSVTGSNVYGCSNTATQLIKVNPLPIVNAAVSSTHICTGENITLIASGASSYIWTSNTIYLQGNPVAITALQNNSFTLTGTDNKGCAAQYTFNLTTNACVGIDENAKSHLMATLSPNPNTGEFFVESGTEKPYRIQIIDPLGKLVHETNSSGQKTEVNITHLSNGIYYVKLISEDSSRSIKIIKSN